MRGVPASRRLAAVPPSPIREVLQRANALERAGRRILHFELGRPDFDTPANIKRAAADALMDGQVHYTSNAGIEPLRAAIARKLDRDNGLVYAPGNEIMVTAGLSEALLSTFLAFLDPGDEVIVPEPTWPHYSSCAMLCDAQPIPVLTHDQDGFIPDPDAIAAAVTRRTRVIVVNSPANPTGSLWPAEVLERIGVIAERHGIVLVSDEIYEGLVWAGEHVSTAAVGGNRERTLTLNGFSKKYSMTGWRLGYVAGPPQLLSRVLRVHQYNTVCVSTFSQYGAIEAYDGDQEPQWAMREAFRRRRDIVLGGLAAVPGLSMVPPSGGFYAFPKIELAVSAVELCRRLLERCGVATVPGDGFGSSGQGHLRLSFAASEDDLREGVGRIRSEMERLAGTQAAGHQTGAA